MSQDLPPSYLDNLTDNLGPAIFFDCKDYTVPLQSNLNVTENIQNNLDGIAASGVKKQLIEFIKKLNLLLLLISRGSLVHPLPKLTLIQSEDNSVLCEWKFYDFRFGFGFELNESESYWYLVSNKNLENLSVSGDFKPQDMDSVLEKAIKYAIENS